MKINKNIKIFINYFLGPVLFLWLSWSIYNQIKNQPGLGQSWQHIKEAFTSSAIMYLIAAVLLMFVNWGLEAYKWMLAVRKIQPIGFLKAFKAVLSGVSVSVSTPNRVGEYFGRVLYVNEGNRVKAISLTIVGSISQLITTILMGLVALFFLQKKIVATEVISDIWVKAILYGTSVVLVILALFYFRLSWLVKIIDKLPAFRKYSWVIEALEEFDATILLRFLSLSIGRFCIFILQYYLLFRLYGVDIAVVQVWLGVSVMFLVMAMIPTIALFTDLGLRNELSIRLVGLFSDNHLAISLTSISVWLINLVVPAVIGSLLILGLRNIIKNRNEGD